MTLHAAFWTGSLLCALAAAGCVYQLVALVLFRRFFGQTPATARETRGVTMLKPLHGAEPRLEANLASFLDQRIGGPVQIVFGVGQAGDPALAAAARLRQSHPEADIALTVGAAAAGAETATNGKVANLVMIMTAAKHDVLVLSDSDMAVGPDYLATVLGALAEPGAGAVTCLYRGRGDAGLWSRVSAGAISYIAMPAMVVGHVTGMARPCMGSTIALRRETLAAIGGFAAFTQVLADDHAIGAAVTAIGGRIVIPPMLLVHGCSEHSFTALWRQKLRWSATIRAVAPLGHAGSIVTYPLPLALLAALFLPAPGLTLAAASVALRLALAAAVDRRAGAPSASRWLLPLSEAIEFLAFIASFAARRIDWRGSRLRMERDGRIAA